MLSIMTPLYRAQSWGAICQTHVHLQEDLERVRMAWLTAALLLTKAINTHILLPTVGQWKGHIPQSHARGLARYCHLSAIDEFSPWLLETSGFFEETLPVYPSALKPCSRKWGLFILWDGIVPWKVLWVRQTGVLIPFLSLPDCLTVWLVKWNNLSEPVSSSVKLG